MMRDIRQRGEYLLARIGLSTFRRLPLPAATGMAHAIADTFYAMCRQRRRIAVNNILGAGIVSEPKAARLMARQSFRHFAELLVETLHADKLTANDNNFSWEIHPDSQPLLDDPKRKFILASGHLGSWEIGAQALSHRKPITAVARNVNNPYVDRYLKKINPRRRIRQISKYGGQPFRMLSMVNDGEILALMIDQHARQQSVWVDFFDRPVACYTAVALLPLVLRCPLCFASCIRTAAGQYRMTLSEPLSVERTGDRNADVRRVLGDLNQRLETAIRRYPEQYLWAHRRWRTLPPHHVDWRQNP